nr:LysR family transcriptional regulator [uncultured bacterium]
MKLTARQGRGLRLTEAGQRLVAHAHRIFADLEEAQADLASLARGASGTLRLGAFPTAAHALVPRLIEVCQQQYPALRITVQEHEADHSIPALRAGELDAALVYQYDVLPEYDDPAVELTALFDDPMLIALPPNHPAAGPEVHLVKLRDETWIAPREDSICRAAVLRACELAGVTPRFEFATGDYAVTLALVQAGLGVAFVPQLALAPLVTTAELFPVADLRPKRRISLAIRSGSAQHPDMAALADALGHVAQPFLRTA